MALRRFGYLEKRFERSPELKKQYCAFLNEYLELKHTELDEIQPNNINIISESFLPHHPVLKPSSTTTKLRVVFDASAKGSTGLSLNDVLCVGPVVQQDLVSIVLRFRKHKFAFTADVEKMYRQIDVYNPHTQFQKILWRSNPMESIKKYRLKTITYGTATAPYLATRTMKQLALDEAKNYPAASAVSLTDFYVDDLISGHENLNDAIKLQKELIEMFGNGGMKLRKWCSNSNALLTHLKAEDCEKLSNSNDIASGDIIKTLGLNWKALTDTFTFCVKPMFQQSVTTFTKRNILSEIAKLFDPLGLLGPTIIKAKILMQKLWLLKLDWDDEVPHEEQTLWMNFRNLLCQVNDIEINRRILIDDVKFIEFHGFANASEIAYGACIYVRSINENGLVTINLLCSKSRIAPIKKTTIPRLELCAALLLSQLVQKVKIAMQVETNRIILWSDSTITLTWIATQSNKLKPFVGNRIAEMQELTANSCQWRHVNTDNNPADLISRGLMPNEMKNATTWWNGPHFLYESEDTWPNLEIHKCKDDTPELKLQKLSFLVWYEFEFIYKLSSLLKIQRIMAYVMRFTKNLQNSRENRSYDCLTTTEISSAMKQLVKVIQFKEFRNELKLLKSETFLKSNSQLKCLNIFLDTEGIIRVGGRLHNAKIDFNHKHPVLLPTTHHIVTLLVQKLHNENGHAGQQALLSILRQNFWVIRAKSLIRKVIFSCIKCFRLKPRGIEQFMGNLPASRVQLIHPFINVGVDYCGPFLIKEGNPRKPIITKAYVSIFICMATKAIHIEVVSNMTTERFISALYRFISRRGKCQNIYSDNGSNFVSANTQLKELRELFKSQSHQIHVKEFCLSNNIQWHFIPPRAPHFGGIWEAAVKSMKYHFKRITGTTKFTNEELSTITSRIESMLNSRPLFPESDDPQDLNAITPGHFLNGRPLNAILEPDLQYIKVGRLSRWQMLTKINQDLWNRWSSEYLGQLQQRKKNFKQIVNIVPDMLVILKEDNTPQNCWMLARITDVHPGTDGVVRVVTVRTQNTTFKRSVNKICILPVQSHNVEI